MLFPETESGANFFWTKLLNFASEALHLLLGNARGKSCAASTAAPLIVTWRDTEKHQLPQHMSACQVALSDPMGNFGPAAHARMTLAQAARTKTAGHSCQLLPRCYRLWPGINLNDRLPRRQAGVAHDSVDSQRPRKAIQPQRCGSQQLKRAHV